jgi:SET domain-containing protein
MGMINDASYIPRKIIRKKKKKIDITPDANYDVNNNKLINNCEFMIDIVNEKAYVHTICDIASGTELFISYGPDYWN